MTNKKSKKVIKVFNPGKDFPAISLSGTDCELACAHCGGQYLTQMLPVDSPEHLIKTAKRLNARGATGALISGGCDAKGRVMLSEYLSAFRTIKIQTPLILNIHTGLLDEQLAQELGETGVDIASVDIVGDSDTIGRVYGLKHSPDQYKHLLRALTKSGIKKIVPHVCVGLDFGRVVGEFRAIDLITSIEPAALVFLVLIPTKNSRMAQCAPPRIDEVIKVINYARMKLSQTPTYLGCMRPRAKRFRKYNRELERKAIEAGINGIVLPSKDTLDYLRNSGFQIKTHKNCCAVG
ncbi:radical SAM protein [[Eubacterium] cellulosolvens]